MVAGAAAQNQCPGDSSWPTFICLIGALHLAEAIRRRRCRRLALADTLGRVSRAQPNRRLRINMDAVRFSAPPEQLYVYLLAPP